MSCPDSHQWEAWIDGESHLHSEQTIHIKECGQCQALLGRIEEERRWFARIRQTSGGTDQGFPTIPGYRFRRMIGRGGQGRVYEAFHAATGRTVAVKVFDHHDEQLPALQMRFHREIHAIAKLQHPNIVTLYDTGTTLQSVPYFVMAYIDGVPFDEYCRQILQPTEIMSLFGRICDAVIHAHDKGIIHRDLKPSNILVDRSGRPHLVDFGLALFHEPSEVKPRLTQTGGFVGTAAYASPEQRRGRTAAVDKRSDIYALGVMLFEVVTENHASANDSDQQQRVMKERQHQTSLSVKLKRVIARATATNPADRYANVRDFLADTERAMRAETSAKDRESWTRRNPLMGRFAFPVLAILIAVAVAALTRFAHLNRELDSLGRNLDLKNARLAMERGDFYKAENALWDLLLNEKEDFNVDQPNLPEDERSQRLTTSPTHWALWQWHATQPCLSTEHAPRGTEWLALVPRSDRRFVWNQMRQQLELVDSSGHLLRAVGAPAKPAFFSFSENGEKAAVCYTNETLQLWSLADLTVSPFWHWPNIRKATVALSNSGRNVAAITNDDRIQHWDVPSQSAAPVSGDRIVQAAGWDNGSAVVHIDNNNLWHDDDHPNVSTQLPVPQRGRSEIILSPDGRFGAINEGGRFLVIDRRTAAIVATLSRTSQVLFTSNGQRCVTGTGDGKVIVFDTASWEPTVWHAHGSPIIDLAFQGDEKVLVSLDSQGMARTWDLENESAVRRFPAHSSSIHTLLTLDDNARKDGLRILTGGSRDDSTIRAWSFPEMKLVAEWEGHASRILGLGYSAQRSAIVSLGHDGVLSYWNADNASRISRSRIPSGRPSGLTVTEQGNAIVTTTFEGRLQRWQWSASRPTCTLADLGGVRVCHIVEHAGTLAFCDYRGDIHLSSSDCGSEIVTLRAHDGPVRRLAFSPDGRWLASGGDDRTIQVRDAETGRLHHTWEAHPDPVFALTFLDTARSLPHEEMKDDKPWLLVTAGDRSGLRLWSVDPHVWKELAVLDETPKTIFDLSPLGDSLLAIGYADGSLGILDLRHFDRHINSNLSFRKSGRETGIH